MCGLFYIWRIAGAHAFLANCIEQIDFSPIPVFYSPKFAVYWRISFSVDYKLQSTHSLLSLNGFLVHSNIFARHHVQVVLLKLNHIDNREIPVLFLFIPFCTNFSILKNFYFIVQFFPPPFIIIRLFAFKAGYDIIYFI